MNTETTTHSAALLLDCKNQLGEGITWHSEMERVFWVDIQQARLHSCREDGSDFQTTQFDERVSAFSFGNDQKMILAMASGLASYDLETETLERFHLFEPDLPSTRMNDGKNDRNGNFIVGGMDENGLNKISSVLHIAADRTVTPLILGVGCTNSLAFNKEGSEMYFACTSERHIYRYHYDSENALVYDRKLFATLGDDSGFPDGSTVDDENHLWNAHWSGGRITRYTPNGEITETISLPVSNVTCCTFGGKNMNRLFITTAWDELSVEQREQQPLAGGLFYLDTDTSGIADTTNRIAA